MLGAISKYINDVSVLRRLLFAVIHLPQDLPNLWGVAVEFATNGKESRDAINAQQAQLFMENMRSLDVTAFSTDRHLLQDLVEFQVLTHGSPCSVTLGALWISMAANFCNKRTWWRLHTDLFLAITVVCNCMQCDNLAQSSLPTPNHTHSSRFLDSNLLVLFSSASTISACCVLQSFSWGKTDQLLSNTYPTEVLSPFPIQAPTSTSTARIDHVGLHSIMATTPLAEVLHMCITIMTGNHFLTLYHQGRLCFVCSFCDVWTPEYCWGNKASNNVQTSTTFFTSIVAVQGPHRSKFVLLLTIPEKCYPTELSCKYFVGPVQVLHAFLCVNCQLCWQVHLMLICKGI